MVDLKNPEIRMTKYGDDGPTFFRIAHTNIATDKSYACEHLVLITMAMDEPPQAEEAKKEDCSPARKSMMERLHGKRKPRIALGRMASGMRKMKKNDRKPPEGYSACEARTREVQTRVKIAAHNRNAIELSKHYIGWKDCALECFDCERRCPEADFKMMTEKHAGGRNAPNRI